MVHHYRHRGPVDDPELLASRRIVLLRRGVRVHAGERRGRRLVDTDVSDGRRRLELRTMQLLRRVHLLRGLRLRPGRERDDELVLVELLVKHVAAQSSGRHGH